MIPSVCVTIAAFIIFFFWPDLRHHGGDRAKLKPIVLTHHHCKSVHLSVPAIIVCLHLVIV